jgi:3'-phosphoadenosine 5'-phosphosulfate sulfotransferase (PAPS reductase)/FAD synthetase
MADHLKETLRELGELSIAHSRVAVGFSGGKDSLAVLDLATKFFKEVIPYFYYFVPGLKHEESKLKIAAERYGLKVRMYPSASGLDALRDGMFCDEHPELESLPQMSRRTLYSWIKADTGATLMMTGEKKSDGPFRRRRIGSMQRTDKWDDMVLPIRNWLKWEVLAYCKANRIEIPDAGRGDNGRFTLHDSEILHAYDHHREDYEVMKEFFPYIETVVLRREWFPDSAA